MVDKAPEEEQITEEHPEHEVMQEDTGHHEHETDNAEEPEKSHLLHPNHSSKSHIDKLKDFALHKKKLSIPLTIALVLAVLAAIPYSRYALAGMVLKQDFSVAVVDATTKEPISSATVSIGSATAVTNSKGLAVIKAKPGHTRVRVTKKYYKDFTAEVLVLITKQKRPYDAAFVADGRQVPLVITNKITGKAVENITVKAAGTEVKTDKDGKVILVVPAAGPQKLDATISGNGFNSTSVSITVTEKASKDNSFMLTPSGTVYFLSKLSGKIDVVKTNLDGTERKTVLAGTGKEEDRGTVLLASRNWKYLALLSRRDSDKAKLYLIETGSDKVSVMDEGDATFNLNGWSDNTFVYTVSRTSKQYYEPKAYAIKSFNAETKKLTTLSETTGENAAGTTFYQNFGRVYLAGGFVVYSVSVYSENYYAWNAPVTITAGIYSLRVDGGDKKTLKSLSAPADNYTRFPGISSEKPGPQEIEFSVSGSGTTTKYVWDHGAFKTVTGDEQDNETYLTYLESPSGKSTFWHEPRDGKNTLLIGDVDGKNGKTVSSLSEYITYGWYSDSYLLVSKAGSELYILPAEEIVDTIRVLKISDYHKPSYSYDGYGGGYGGL